MHLLPTLQFPDNIKNLIKIAEENPVISLNKLRFDEYVQGPHKDYSFLVLYTGPIVKCDRDRHIFDIYLKISKALTETPEFKTKLFFGAVNIVEEPALFELAKVRYLQDIGKLLTKESPILIHFPVSGNLSPADYIHLEDIEIDKVQNTILGLIETRAITDVEDNITIMNSFWGKAMLVREKIFWMYLTVGLCIFAVAGEMYNFIEDPPFIYYNQYDYVIIPKSLYHQTILENIIVLVLIIIYVASMIRLIDFLTIAKKRSRNFSNEPKDGAAAIFISFMFASYGALYFILFYKLT